MVRLDEQQPPGPAEEELFGAIACRRTNRSAFEDRPLPDALLDNLQRCAEREGAGARVIRKLKEREAVASLVTEGDRIQGADPAFRRELAATPTGADRAMACRGMRSGRAISSRTWVHS